MNEPIENTELRRAAELITGDVGEVLKLLSPEERAEYERCAESIVEARRSAQQNEGHIVIW